MAMGLAVKTHNNTIKIYGKQETLEIKLVHQLYNNCAINNNNNNNICAVNSNCAVNNNLCS